MSRIPWSTAERPPPGPERMIRTVRSLRQKHTKGAIDGDIQRPTTIIPARQNGGPKTGLPASP
eukprot:scaffold181650_cov16-Prasinocladus_malaysianus.AAC.1